MARPSSTYGDRYYHFRGGLYCLEHAVKPQNPPRDKYWAKTIADKIAMEADMRVRQTLDVAHRIEQALLAAEKKGREEGYNSGLQTAAEVAETRYCGNFGPDYSNAGAAIAARIRTLLEKP